MNDPKPIACSLGAEDLRRRLERVAAVGAAGLIDREDENGGHVLRFRSDPETRRGLREIVAAEAECCPFLDLELSEGGEEIVLTISAPPDGRLVADELAHAFARHRVDDGEGA